MKKNATKALDLMTKKRDKLLQAHGELGQAIEDMMAANEEVGSSLGFTFKHNKIIIESNDEGGLNAFYSPSIYLGKKQVYIEYVCKIEEYDSDKIERVFGAKMTKKQFEFVKHLDACTQHDVFCTSEYNNLQNHFERFLDKDNH